MAYFGMIIFRRCGTQNISQNICLHIFLGVSFKKGVSKNVNEKMANQCPIR